MRKHKSSSIHSVHCSKLYNQLSSKSSCQLDFKHQQTMLCRNRPGCFYTGNPSRALLAGVPQRGLWIPMKRSLSGRQSNSLIHCRRNCAVQRLQLSVGLLHDDGSLSSSSAVSMLSCWSSAGSWTWCHNNNSMALQYVRKWLQQAIPVRSWWNYWQLCLDTSDVETKQIELPEMHYCVLGTENKSQPH